MVFEKYIYALNFFKSISKRQTQPTTNRLYTSFSNMSHAPAHCTTEFDHELIKFLSEHYESGVFHAKGHAEPPRTPDVAAYAAAGGNMIDVGFGPLRVIGNIQGLGISGEVGVNVPILGYKKLINISGDLLKGVEAGFDLFGVASGSIRVSLQGKDVMVTPKASILGQNLETSFKIFTLP
ncbi:hypothetical protein C8Q75DRAFT_786522 [Abortiporus biennis]|nr:hypothetical protein C8Q75DRAFT_786522 [Abortiporus biennis]